MTLFRLGFVPTILVALACGGKKIETKSPASMTLTSTAFTAGAAIPEKQSCDGGDASPQLAWTAGPQGTLSYAIVCDDPDAPLGTWVHWVAYAIPPTITNLDAGIPAAEATAQGWKQGQNSFHKLGYGGPCPPAGSAHHYYFRVYALDNTPTLPPGATKGSLANAMENHILAWGELVGTYQRK